MINRSEVAAYEARAQSRWSSRVIVALALAAFICPLGGCFGAGSAGGEGTVDIASAKAATNSNPDMAKAAASRGKAGIVDAQKKARR
jgi:hypothetical protein